MGGPPWLARTVLTKPSMRLLGCAATVFGACLLAACGTAPAGGPQVDGSGGEPASGGQGGGSGGQGSGGSGGTGGAASSDVPGGACRSRSDCSLPMVIAQAMAFVSCASPFTPNQDMIIGGIDPRGWCGSVDCPSVAPAPLGHGQACATDDDCPTAGDGPLASTCSDQACVACAAAEDCPTEAPFCVFGQTFRPAGGLAPVEIATACVACLSDEDCGGETPGCVYVANQGPTCVECRTTQHCATGVCDGQACVPACVSDADCPDPATACTNARCEPKACAEDGSCPDNMACTEGTCHRRGCESDAVCEGHCVNGACFETFGDCVSVIAYP